MLTPALYRTRITHLRRAPVHHYFEHRSYSWYVDIDRLPELPRWLRPFARFEASDHFDGAPDDTLRQRVDNFLADRGIDLRGGTVTALLQARVLGYVFNPLSLFWCHDADGVLRHVIAEVHNTYGGRHAYLLPPDAGQPAMVTKKLYVSPFNAVDGYYLVRAPRPDSELNVTISLHRENQPAFVATMRGSRRPAGIRQILQLQLTAPLAPLMGSVGIRVQGITLWLRRVPLYRGRRSPRRKGSSSCDCRHRRAVPVSRSAPSGGRMWRGFRPVRSASSRRRSRIGCSATPRPELPLRMVYPDGTVVGAADPTLPTMVIHRPDRLARRIGRYGLIGFGESYMAGEWSSDDLAGVLTEFASSVGDLMPRSLQRSVRSPLCGNRVRSSTTANRPVQNISEHYDLSNELFGEFLDETLTYSSALFDTLPATRSQLADAQRHKIDRLLDSAKVGPAVACVEIGTGWGELCIRAAARGALVRSVTLSAEQQQLARAAGRRRGPVGSGGDRTARLPRCRRLLRRRAFRWR